MKLLLFRHLWGIDQPWEVVLPKIKAAGYDGLEAPLTQFQREDPDLEHMRAHGFQVLPMLFTTGDTVDDHIVSFRRQYEAALPLDPTCINVHDGRDAWTDAESARYFEAVLRIEAEHAVPTAHETHRGRIFYNPWTTARLLDRFPDLRLCCDYSHWVCVCERLLDDLEPLLATCARHALHIHARIGYAEGPQVPDPSAPEYRPHLEAHERWWAMIWNVHQAASRPFTTLTPEFGPPPYLHTLPHTKMPVANLWDICDWQARRQKERFDEWVETC